MQNKYADLTLIQIYIDISQNIAVFLYSSKSYGLNNTVINSLYKQRNKNTCGNILTNCISFYAKYTKFG